MWPVEGQELNDEASLVQRVARDVQQGVGDLVGLPLTWQLVGTLHLYAGPGDTL